MKALLTKTGMLFFSLILILVLLAGCSATGSNTTTAVATASSETAASNSPAAQPTPPGGMPALAAARAGIPAGLLREVGRVEAEAWTPGREPMC